MKTQPPVRRSFLSPAQRLFWLGVNFFLGQLPALLFFIWVERNAAFAISWVFPNWPRPEPFTSWQAASGWNLVLISLFGAIHTGTAQIGFYTFLEKLAPVQALRTLYLAITGCAILLLLTLWQNTGIVLWVLPGPAWLVRLISLTLYWSLMGMIYPIFRQFKPLEFVGLSQIYSTTTELKSPVLPPLLHRTGLYQYVRHPIYALTLSAFALAPIMTLDRLLILIGSAFYLSWGIPIEERKLIRLFGPTYLDYRREVPALIPKRLAFFKSHV